MLKLHLQLCYFLHILLRAVLAYKMKTDLAEKYVFELLEDKLPQHLNYHNVHHTKYVLSKAIYIANKEDITEEDLLLLRTAVVLHDAGFIGSNIDEHEEESCKIARDILPGFEYTEQQIELVCKMIMATKSLQAPKNLLEKILCDANLYYLGTEEFFDFAENLFQERTNLNMIKDRKEWFQTEIKFLSLHSYYTETGSELEPQKKRNLLSLKSQSFFFSDKKVRSVSNFLRDASLIVSGVIIAGFALKSFLVPNHFLDGGITGISLMIHEKYNFYLGYIIVVLNLPFIVLCKYLVNLRYALKTLLCVVLLGVCLLWVPYRIITFDNILVPVFGGFFLGAGMGLLMRAGCAVDGIEVFALYIRNRTSFTISEIILAINACIFSIAAFYFDIEKALYAMLTYFTASKTIDYVVEGFEAYTGVTIISGKSDEIKNKLMEEMKVGITVFKGERGFLPSQFEVFPECDIIFAVITRLELRQLKNIVIRIDPDAFVSAHIIREVTGGVIRHRHAE